MQTFSWYRSIHFFSFAVLFTLCLSSAPVQGAATSDTASEAARKAEEAKAETDINRCFKLRKCKSMVVSKPLIPGEIAEGVLYSIPTQPLEFSIARKGLTVQSLQDAVEKAREAVDNKNDEVTTKQSEVNSLDEKARAAESTDVIAKLNLESELAKIELLILQRQKRELEQALQSAETKLSAFDPAHQGMLFEDSISLIALSPAPDATLKFSARLNNNAFSSETLEIKTNVRGLLSGGSGKSEGQADEIFVALAKAIATLNSPISFSPESFALEASRSAARRSDCTAKDGDKYSVRFSLENLNKTLTHIKNDPAFKMFCYELELEPSIKDEIDSCEIERETQGYYDGLLYPTKSNIEFDLSSTENTQIHRPLFVEVISSCYLGRLPLYEGFLADNEFEYEFKDGLLTRYKSVTPNQLLSFLNLIPEAGKALLSIPGELIQLKIDFSSKEKAYYEAQQAAVAARASYEGYLNSFPANQPEGSTSDQ